MGESNMILRLNFSIAQRVSKLHILFLRLGASLRQRVGYHIIWQRLVQVLTEFFFLLRIV